MNLISRFLTLKALIKHEKLFSNCPILLKGSEDKVPMKINGFYSSVSDLTIDQAVKTDIENTRT